MYTLDRLLKGGGPQRDEQSTIDHPLEHLVACHERIEERLSVLERAAALIEEQPEAARSALESVWRYFETSGMLHTADEEESLFPRIQGRLTPAESQYVARLEEQHREAEGLYERLKAGHTDADSVGRFCALYREHIASENRDLMAAARRVLNAGDLEAIAAGMKRRRGLA